MKDEQYGFTPCNECKCLVILKCILVPLHIECSEEDILTIAEYDFEWKRVFRRLLSDRKVRDIDNEGGSEADKRDKMLLEWKRAKSRDATYQALVKILRAIDNNATADRVEKLERKRKSPGNKMHTKSTTSYATFSLVKNAT